MSQNSSDANSCFQVRIGCFSLLTIIFIVLKLCNQIDWSWWWVLAPTWVPIALTLLFIGCCFAVALWDDFFDKK